VLCGEMIPNLQGEYTQYHFNTSFTDELLNYRLRPMPSHTRVLSDMSVFIL